MIKTVHILDRAEYLLLKDHFDPIEGSHYENLANGRILLVANFRDSGHQEAFENRAKSRITLPHPIHQKSDPISEAAAQELHTHPELFKEHDTKEKKLKAAKQSTVHDICSQMTKHNPKFRLF